MKEILFDKQVLNIKILFKSFLFQRLRAVYQHEVRTTSEMIKNKKPTKIFINEYIVRSNVSVIVKLSKRKMVKLFLDSVFCKFESIDRIMLNLS